MNHAVPYEIREALGMPLADIPAACERIRTLRQTEQLAGEVLSGRLGRWRVTALAPEEPPRECSPGRKGLALRIALAAAAAAVVLALLLGWAAVVDQPQGDTWKLRFQSGGNVSPGTELPLRAARRDWAIKNN